MRPVRLRILWLPIVVISAMFLAPFQTQAAAAATILRVPQDHPTIQAAVDVAAAGDTVLVSPGTYQELVDFLGKAITVESTGGPSATIIDGNHTGTVVRIDASPDQTPALRGFTIQNGSGSSGSIVTQGGPALIEGNRVTGNTTCSGAIEATFSAATIRGNFISGNQSSCSGGGGGGISVGGAGTATVVDNVITDNHSGGDGGGIDLFAAGSPTISNNVISNNSSASFGAGGGISLVNASNALITNNFIVENESPEGAGIYWLVPSGQPGPVVVNNTIADNIGSAVFADGFDVAARLVNNVLVASGPQATLHCGDFNDPIRP